MPQDDLEFWEEYFLTKPSELLNMQAAHMNCLKLIFSESLFMVCLYLAYTIFYV